MTTMRLLSSVINRPNVRVRQFSASASSFSAYKSADGRGTLFSSTSTPATRTTRTMATQVKRCLNMEDLNPCVKEMEYAVRGPLVIRAGEIEKELEKV